MNVIEITADTSKSTEQIRLGAYCRVSSDSEDQLHSFAAQIRHYKDYERRHPEYKLVDIYADEGLTGTTTENRSELHRLIRDCQKGKIDRVIIKSVSRLARNTRDLLVAIRMFKDLGVSVYFEEQDIDTEKMNMEMIVTFPGMLAQQESESISGNMRWSYKKRMESGEFNCCYAAYGYKLVDGSLVIDESEAQVVRRIFDMYLKGVSEHKIASILSSEAVLNRGGQSYWRRTTIHYILNNERYIGNALLQKSFTTDTLPFRRKRNKGERPQYYVENSNPAIICRETYAAVQSLQKIRSANKAQKSTSYLFSGILRCSECGCLFRRQLIRGKAYWMCSSKSAGETDCKSRRLREKELYFAAAFMLSKLSSHRAYIIEPLIRQLKAMYERSLDHQTNIRRIDQQIADIAAKKHIVATLHNNGVLTASEYALQSSEFDRELTTLRAERKKAYADNDNNKQLEELITLYDKLDEYEPYSDFDHDLFKSVVQEIIVDSSKEITFVLTGELKLPEEIPERGRCKCE